ncbi:MAG: YfhO family protein [Candidatus Sumerlaeia bacterium]|nr:YfhO family protein [Candidatus Sumerlaeia bacterium]
MKYWLNILLSCLIFLSASIILLGDVLNNNYVLYGRDTVSHDYIVFHLGWQSVREHLTLPLWTPYLFAGIPFIGSLAFCPFYPLNLSGLLLPLPLAFNIQYFLALIIAGLTFFYFSRSFQLSWVSSIFGGLMFLSSGHLVSLIYPGHLQKVQSIVWLPFIIGSANFFLQKRHWKYIIMAGIGLALQLTAGHLQIFFYTVQLLFVFILYDWLLQTVTTGINRTLWQLHLKTLFFSYLLPIGCCLLIGLCLAGVQLLPTLEMASVSNRSPKVAYEEAVHGSFPPEELPELLLPRFLGDSTEKGYSFYRGRWGERLVTDYVGAGVWIFAILGLLHFHKTTYARWRCFFLLIFIFSTLLALGKFSPAFRFFYEYVPGYNKFRSPATIMILMTFSLVTLAGFGLETFWQKIKMLKYTSRQQRQFLLYASIMLIISSACFLAYLLIGSTRLHTSSILFYSPFLLPAISRVAFNAGVILLVMALIIRVQGERQYQIISFAILIFVTFNDLRTNDRIFITRISKTDYHNYLFNHWADNIISQIAVNTSSTSGLDTHQPLRLFEDKNALITRMIARRIATPHGYHPVGFKRYFELLNKYWFDNPMFLRLFNVRFIITETPERYESLGFHIVAVNGRQYLMQADEKNIPYIYVSQNEAAVKPGEALKIMPAEFDLARWHVVEYPMIEIPGFSHRINFEQINFNYKVTKYLDNEIELIASCDQTCNIVLSEPNFTGWEYWLDGKQYPIYTANHLFRSVKLPAGTHSLKFVYRPFSFRIGLYISLVFMLGVLTYFFIRLKRPLL